MTYILVNGSDTVYIDMKMLDLRGKPNFSHWPLNRLGTYQASMLQVSVPEVFADQRGTPLSEVKQFSEADLTPRSKIPLKVDFRVTDMGVSYLCDNCVGYSSVTTSCIDCRRSLCSVCRYALVCETCNG